MINNTYFEMNTTTLSKSGDYASQTKLHGKSKMVEVCSKLFLGQDLSKFDGKLVDATANKIKELSNAAMRGDNIAKYELNEIQRYVIAPVMTELIQLPSFFGSVKDIGFNVQPRIATYKTENNDPRFQATGADFGLATTSRKEYPLATQAISHGYAVDYRAAATGDFDTINYGLSEVKNVLMNKMMTYIVLTLYTQLKASANIKYFYEQAGITSAVVDKAVSNVRRFGKGRCAMIGDWNMVTQLNDLQGFTTATGVKLFSEEVMNEFRKMGYAGQYKGADVIELQNDFNTNKLNTAGDNFKPYMPDGLLFVIPQNYENQVIQTVRRGGLTSASALDIISGQEITRFDMEIGTSIVPGREWELGIISDNTKDTPDSFM